MAINAAEGVYHVALLLKQQGLATQNFAGGHTRAEDNYLITC